MKKNLHLFALCILAYFIPVAAAAATPDWKRLIANAEDAFYKKADRKQMDFWLARFIGLADAYPQAGHSTKDVEPLLKKRKLTPKAFIPSDWDAGFLEWFEKGIHARWAAEDKKVREKYRSVEIAESSLEGKYFIKVVAYPEMELWHVVDKGVVKDPFWMTMASYSDKPSIFFGKALPGMKRSLQFTSMFLNTERRTLHYVWQPEFYDLDKDGVPEVWLRFNVGWGNGYAQILDIYQIRNENELVLMRRFKAEPEGIARRLPDGNVQIAVSKPSNDHFPRMQYDLHHLEVWEYGDKGFKKISEEDRPLILRTPAWKDYM